MRSLIVIALACMATLANAADVRLVASQYPPFIGSGMKAGGPLQEIVVAAYAETGHAAEVRYVPWVRALREVQAGSADGLLGAWRTSEREKTYLFSSPILFNELVLMKRDGEAPAAYSGFDAIRGFRIGVVRGYAAPTGFNEADFEVIEFPSDTLNLTALARGRVDLVMIDRAVARFLLETELPGVGQSIVAVEPPIQFRALHVALSRAADGAEAKLRGLEEGLGRLREEGIVQSIAERYSLAWEQPM